MKDKWYGDNRDIAKWSILLLLAQKMGIKEIVQIAYFREDRSDNSVQIDGDLHEIPQMILQQFPRNLRDIERLNSDKVRIRLFDNGLTSHEEYTNLVIDFLKKSQVDEKAEKIVFLDPDTGLQPPKSSAKLEHVKNRDLLRIWGEMNDGDILVFYQHKTKLMESKFSEGAIQQKMEQFANAIYLDPKKIQVATAKIAPDVVFFFVQKPIEDAGESVSNYVEKETVEIDPKRCPIPNCDKVFRKGWSGIDSHWRAFHSDIAEFSEVKESIKNGTFQM